MTDQPVCVQPVCDTPGCTGPAKVIVSDGVATAQACAECHTAMLRRSGGRIRGIGLVSTTTAPGTPGR